MIHIILLRGLAREAAHWHEFPTQLQTALHGDCQIHLIDFPGCGKYFRQPALTTIEAMTDHARAEPSVVTALASGAPIFVIGISMGGMIALDWTQRFPNEMAGVVLINSSSGDQPTFWRLRPAALPSVLYALLLPMQQREARVLRLVSNDTQNFQQNLQQWLVIQLQRPITRLTVVKMLRAAARFRPHALCIVKGLVMTSRGDRMVSNRASEAIAEKFNWELVSHPSAGHDLPMDDAEWTVSQITRWMVSNA